MQVAVQIATTGDPAVREDAAQVRTPRSSSDIRLSAPLTENIDCLCNTALDCSVGFGNLGGWGRSHLSQTVQMRKG